MLFSRNLNVQVSIDFPALSALVSYLEGQQQQKIDALTTEVTTLTKSLSDSRTGLKGSVDNSSK